MLPVSCITQCRPLVMHFTKAISNAMNGFDHRVFGLIDLLSQSLQSATKGAITGIAFRLPNALHKGVTAKNFVGVAQEKFKQCKFFRQKMNLRAAFAQS